MTSDRRADTVIGIISGLILIDRVEGRDAASSRRVPSHDGLAGTGDDR